MDMLYRLETMMMMGIDLPLTAISRQIASAIDVVIHLGRLRDKSRRVLEIAEVLGYVEGKIQTQTMYKFEEEEYKNEKISGILMKREELVYREKLLAAGYK
jgi:pilus assembly protein CpaF